MVERVMTAVTTRYVIARGGQFLIDLYRNEPVWSVAAQDCFTTGHAWVDHTTATSKLNAAKDALNDHTLGLALVTMKRVGVEWQLLQQQGVRK